jgi:hypothetical protein
MSRNTHGLKIIIDFANAKVIDKGNHRDLKTLES